MTTLRYAYYPGCSLESSAKEYDTSTRAVCDLLGVELVDIEDWNCCGATPAGQDELLAHSLSARNLAWAEERGLDVIAPCSECYKNLARAAQALREDPHMRAEINAVLAPLSLRGKVRVKHPLEVIVRDVGLDRVRSLVKFPLARLRAAPYYGCLITRPRNDFDSPENPTAMEELFEALGAKNVDYYPYKTRCCGGALLLSNQPLALRMTRDLVTKAKEQGANALALGCPMCDMMLDVYQSQAVGEDVVPLPVVFFTQLMGLALGIEPSRLGFDARVTPAEKLLGKLGVEENHVKVSA
jgi:heterodisulfide reductase subunit B